MVPSITEDEVTIALRAFLLAILPAGMEVIRGQENRVPEPQVANYVVFWPTHRSRLSTNEDTWDTANPDPDSLEHRRGTQTSMQLDIHGPAGADNSQVIATLWRDDYAMEAIDGLIFVPLFASDGHQMPFINGEQQYEDRWVMTVEMQVNPVISTPMEFADTVAAAIVPPVGA